MPKRAIALSGYNRINYFRRACKFYTDQFPDYDLFLCSNDINASFDTLVKEYSLIKNIKVLPVNRGFHAGAIDVINGALELAVEYDWVLSTHCDVLMLDKGKVESVFNTLESDKKFIAGSLLSYGNKGICTESFFLNMPLCRSKNLFPIKNICLNAPSAVSFESQAEHCLLTHFKNYQIDPIILSIRSSYGYFSNLGLLHMHAPQTESDTVTLDKLGLARYSIINF